MGIHENAEELSIILRDCIKEELKFDKEVALMFSGGIDSATLAVLARKYCDLKLYISGLEGSHDLNWGCQSAELLDIPYSCIVYKKTDIIKSLENVVLIHEMDNPRWVSTFVAFDLVLQKIPESLVLCGQGADELFAGYRKYRDMTPDEATTRMSHDYKELANEELPIYQKMAEHYGKTLIAPFLEKEVVKFSQRIPFEHKLDGENKRVLRMAAGVLGVPASMTEKPKKAMQYGSGVSKILKQHIKNSGNDLSGIIDSIKNIGNHYE